MWRLTTLNCPAAETEAPGCTHPFNPQVPQSNPAPALLDAAIQLQAFSFDIRLPVSGTSVPWPLAHPAVWQNDYTPLYEPQTNSTMLTVSTCLTVSILIASKGYFCSVVLSQLISPRLTNGFV